jgi:hypothetical protein
MLNSAQKDFPIKMHYAPVEQMISLHLSMDTSFVILKSLAEGNAQGDYILSSSL